MRVLSSLDSIHRDLRKQKPVLKHLAAASGISALKRPYHWGSFLSSLRCFSYAQRGLWGAGLCRRLPGRRPESPGPCCPLSCWGAPSRSQGMDFARCWSALAAVTAHRRGGSHTKSLFLFCLELDVPDKTLTGPRPVSRGLSLARPRWSLHVLMWSPAHASLVSPPFRSARYWTVAPPCDLV